MKSRSKLVAFWNTSKLTNCLLSVLPALFCWLERYWCLLRLLVFLLPPNQSKDGDYKCAGCCRYYRIGRQGHTVHGSEPNPALAPATRHLRRLYGPRPGRGGVGYQNFTILRTEIINTNRAAYCESTCIIQDSYFHGTNLWPDQTDMAHAFSVRNEEYLTLRHNSLGCDYAGPFPNGEIGCSADMSGYPDFAPIKNDTIDSNLFLSNNIGAGFCVYGGGTAGKPFSSNATNATYIVFKNNVFQRGANGQCSAYGPVTDFISGRCE